jgi:hypothetical protein
MAALRGPLSSGAGWVTIADAISGNVEIFRHVPECFQDRRTC